ncbi:MAG: hypothetical protein J0H86_21655 [Xanthomonadaceae bacterium]|nr:hypothetical protein [Xanthomonadaceae bacterium]
MNSALKRLRSVLPSDFFLLICLTPDCDIESLIRVSEKQGQDQGFLRRLIDKVRGYSDD